MRTQVSHSTDTEPSRWLIHGLVLGSFILLAFGGGLAGLWSLQRGLITTAGIRERMVRLKVGTTVMAVAAWATVLTGTWIAYPWYREQLAGDDLAGCAGLQAPTTTCSPRDFLLSNVSGNTTDWHEFGMEWKEHIAWIAPMLATAAMFLVLYYGGGISRNRTARLITIGFFVTAFVVAGIAGVFGALITKARLYDRLGPLSGKTIIAGAVFFGSWGILTAIWRRSNPSLRTVTTVSVVLVAIGLLGTFPIFFQAFASD